MDLGKLSEEQRAAFDAALLGRSVFISGPGGTGKSFLLHYIVEALRDKGKRVTVASSTGISAISIGGSTIHSCLGTRICGSVDELRTCMNPDLARTFHRRMGLSEVLVIDEISMLSGMYVEMMDYWLRVNKKDKPFGGLQIIAIGDLLQLPPVERSRKKITYRFAFEAPVWMHSGMEVHQLRRSFRQENQAFVDVLNRIRFGECDEEVLKVFEPCIGRKLENPLKLLPTNAEVDRINSDALEECKGDLAIAEAKLTGSPSNQAKLVKNCIVPQILRIKVGCPVLICKNDTEDGLYANGTRGTVESFAPGVVTVKTETGTTVELKRAVWELNEGSRPVATMHQFPLRLAYAITIHKSQGMTLDNVQIDLKKVFAEGQTYVALSRVRTLEGLSLTTPLTPKMVSAHPKIVEFYRG